jgi:hypothetical protein
MLTWWSDVRKAAGLEWEIGFKEIDALRVKQGLLPIVAKLHKFAGRPAEELYDFGEYVRGEARWFLKPEFADLVHENPYRAPHNLREMYIKLVAKRINLA